MIPSKITSLLTNAVVDPTTSSYIEKFHNLRTMKFRVYHNIFPGLQAQLSKLTALDICVRYATEAVSRVHIEDFINNNTKLTDLTVRVHSNAHMPSKIYIRFNFYLFIGSNLTINRLFILA